MEERIAKDLKAILEKHRKWKYGEEDGKRADLRGADLRGVYLPGAYLVGAYLGGVDLSGADLYRADLRWTDLRGAKMEEVNLREADLRGADLRGANLRGADLHGTRVKEAIKTKFYPLACPEEGDFIGWKKAEEKIVKLMITGKRSSAYGRKCRCSAAHVISIENMDGTKAETNEVKSNHDSRFIYRVGKDVTVPDFDEYRWNECSTGIHFFITRKEAEEYKI